MKLWPQEKEEDKSYMSRLKGINYQGYIIGLRATVLSSRTCSVLGAMDRDLSFNALDLFSESVRSVQ